MKSIACMALKAGMQLAEAVTDRRGKIIFKAGQKLTELDIERLSAFHIMVVSILEEEDLATTHFEKIQVSEGFKKFSAVYQEVLPDFIKIIDQFAEDASSFNWKSIMTCYIRITSTVRKGEVLLDYLYNLLPQEDTLIYSHMLNSGLIAGVFGSWLGLSKEDTFLLLQCGFLYDIGKLLLPREIIFKPGKLTNAEFDLVKTHCKLGFELLFNAQLDIHIAKTALMHHERCDGTGYPSKLSDHQIDIFAKYIAIIDSYEAMSSPRSYRQSLHPFQIIENFEKDGFLYYDMNILKNIMFRIASSQVGLKARLSDGREAKIVVLNNHKLSRPILQCENGTMINLDLEKDVKIVSIF